MISRIDHLVLTVRSIETTCAFDQRVIGCRRVDEPRRPTALLFGAAKINLHEAHRTFEPKAAVPTPGGGGFCLIADRALDAVMARLAAESVPVELGPVERTGAQGVMTSVYVRDPDRNLVEVSVYAKEAGR